MTTAHKPTVFVLDDDPAIQDSLSRLLQVMKLPAEFFGTVNEFLDVYDPTRSGYMLLDLRLPGDGFELLKRLSELECTLPVKTPKQWPDKNQGVFSLQAGGLDVYTRVTLYFPQQIIQTTGESQSSF